MHLGVPKSERRCHLTLINWHLEMEPRRSQEVHFLASNFHRLSEFSLQRKPKRPLASRKRKSSVCKFYYGPGDCICAGSATHMTPETRDSCFLMVLGRSVRKKWLWSLLCSQGAIQLLHGSGFLIGASPDIGASRRLSTGWARCHVFNLSIKRCFSAVFSFWRSFCRKTCFCCTSYFETSDDICVTSYDKGVVSCCWVGDNK